MILTIANTYGRKFIKKLIYFGSSCLFFFFLPFQRGHQVSVLSQLSQDVVGGPKAEIVRHSADPISSSTQPLRRDSARLWGVVVGRQVFLEEKRWKQGNLQKVQEASHQKQVGFFSRFSSQFFRPVSTSTVTPNPLII